MIPVLTTITFLPALGGLAALVSCKQLSWCRWISLGTCFLELLAVLLVCAFCNVPGPGGWLLTEDYSWIDSIGVRYALSMDGISLLLVLLTAVLGVLCVLVSWEEIETRVGIFHFLLLTMQTGIVGVFLAADLFLFYLFWEIQLLPMFFLIGIWGHERRILATVKFVVFSIAGSLLMLIAIIGIYVLHGNQTGIYTFSLVNLMETRIEKSFEVWLYAAFVLAFGIKIPLFPVHTWLPDAHTEAPTAGSVILAGLLLKTGAYALFRFAFPLFPRAAAESQSVLIALGLIGLFYAAWIALAQSDLKRLVAYSSISHMGMMTIGLAVWNTVALSGAVLLMINHGLSTAALFIMVGMLYERTGSRDFERFGGLWRTMPTFSGFFLFFALSSAGLPGLNNFVSDILILLGTYREKPAVAALGFAGIVLVLIYVLRMVQDTVFGEVLDRSHLPDLSVRETIVLLPLAAGVLLLGLYPMPVLELLNEPVLEFIQTMNRGLLAGLE